MSRGINHPLASGSAKVIGLLGGIASGKTLVAGLLKDLGAVILDADEAGHEALRLPHVREAVRKQWGEQVLGPDGQVNRRELAKIVFAPPPNGPAELSKLELLTHPEIGRILSARMAAFRGSSPASSVVLDASVMLKAGWDSLCDTIVYVDVPREIRLERALSRGWTEEDFSAREAVQEPLDVKRRRADVVIDNSGSVEQTRTQVERFWKSLTGR